MSMQRTRLIPPDWAVEVIHDLTAWHRRPVPVSTLADGFSFPDDFYFEYAYVDADGNRRPDPDNPRSENAWYDYARAVAGPAYRPDRYNFGARQVEPAGTLDRCELSAGGWFGRRHRYDVYTPPGPAGARLPLLLVHDGYAMQRHGRLPAVLDALITDGRIPPLRAVFARPRDRFADYWFDDETLRYELIDLIPAVEADRPSTGERFLLGFSLGATAALMMAIYAPGAFRSIAAIAPMLNGRPGKVREVVDGPELVRDRLEAAPVLPPRLVTGCGTLDWTHAAHLRLLAGLARRGDVEVDAVSVTAGHNWTAWRNMLADVLVATTREPG
jgi:enterochelin esterase-like enzyme